MFPLAFFNIRMVHTYTQLSVVVVNTCNYPFLMAYIAYIALVLTYLLSCVSWLPRSFAFSCLRLPYRRSLAQRSGANHFASGPSRLTVVALVGVLGAAAAAATLAARRRRG